MGKERAQLETGLDPSLYCGRGQTFAKHVLLKRYITELAFKVLQSPRAPTEFLYVDGFSGPWQAKGERFEDTSFGIVLSRLAEVREKLGSMGKSATMRAVFVEENAAAYKRLVSAVDGHPRVKVTTINGRFEDAIPAIVPMLSPSTFLFAFLDPKGWKGIALERIRPLLRHSHAEVLVNVMTYSIVRHATQSDTQDSFAEFFGGGDWRSELDTMLRSMGREDAILQLYLSRLRKFGSFKYVGTTRIRDPDKARTYFHLAYGTRHHAGMEVFRRSEGHCIEAQERVVLDAFYAKLERKIGAPDLLSGLDDNGLGAFTRWRDASRAKARAEWDAWLAEGRPMAASHRRALLFEYPYVDLPLVNGWAREAMKAGRLAPVKMSDRDAVWTPSHTPS
ncbi:three-Cys-motif partner protein TcmP [Roseicella sp. DB1501]|uniref:three-Cys-motif partner protein TcmP n=1 Tax=Roseicella sp. DB1501 TaxID=2730925 RepID=UPI0014916ABD|nr:three-Cys-motif partner protein TcmP [Roseicella sp. DB1501]NOG73373.1 three-Cys-motif partner protein TcmP [Roseicella sp. DB1501]